MRMLISNPPRAAFSPRETTGRGELTAWEVARSDANAFAQPRAPRLGRPLGLDEDRGGHGVLARRSLLFLPATTSKMRILCSYSFLLCKVANMTLLHVLEAVLLSLMVSVERYGAVTRHHILGDVFYVYLCVRSVAAGRKTC